MNKKFLSFALGTLLSLPAFGVNISRVCAMLEAQQPAPEENQPIVNIINEDHNNNNNNEDLLDDNPEEDNNNMMDEHNLEGHENVPPPQPKKGILTKVGDAVKNNPVKTMVIGGSTVVIIGGVAYYLSGSSKDQDFDVDDDENAEVSDGNENENVAELN